MSVESRAEHATEATKVRPVISEAASAPPEEPLPPGYSRPPRGRTVSVLGIPIRATTLDAVSEEILACIDAGGFVQHGAINAAKLVQMHRDPVLRRVVLGAEIVTADGMGVVIAARLLGTPLPERVAGVDLFLRLAERSAERGHPVYLLGGRGDTADRAAEELRRRFPALKMAGTHHGYFWDEEAATVARIRDSGAKLLFVGITTPLKEEFLHRWRAELGVAFAMGVGGSFDVLAGHTRRAPLWLQRGGLEWLFRMVQEPRRLWRRYLFTNVILAGLLIRERWNRAFNR